MNLIARLLSPVTNALGSILGGMNQRVVDMIRQTYVFVIVILCIVGAIFGFSSGKRSAKKTGVQMAETTNAVFDTDILLEHKRGSFDSVLDSELESGLDMKDPQKSGLPAKERLSGEDNTRISEPEKDRHIISTPQLTDKTDLAVPPRMDDANVTDKNPKTINRQVEKGPADLPDKKISPLIEEPTKSGDIRGEKPQKGRQQTSQKPKPLEKKGGLAE
jgi:hypothetical protein